MLEVLSTIIRTPYDVKEGDFAKSWVLPFEGAVVKLDGHDDIVRAFPDKYAVTATQFRKNEWDDIPEAFTWTDGEHEFATHYWGDSIYEIVTQLDDGLWAMFNVDACLKGCGNELGNTLAETVRAALEEENEYEHVIMYDSYGNEHIQRGNRNLDKVSTEKLLKEKKELEQRIALYEKKREEAVNKNIWTRGITRRQHELEVLNLHLKYRA